MPRGCKNGRVQVEAADVWPQIETRLRRHEDAIVDIARARYEWIGRMVRAALLRSRPGAITLTGRLDRVAIHPLRGLVSLVFFAVLALLDDIGYLARSAYVMVIVPLVHCSARMAVINRCELRGAHSAFIMEMPLYLFPNARTVGLCVWQKTWAFVKKAGGVILVPSAAVWLLSHLAAGDLEASFLARFGRWLGLGNRRLIVALVASLVAKGAATVAMIRQETGAWKWPALSVGLLLVVSFGAAITVYQLARVMGWGA